MSSRESFWWGLFGSALPEIVRLYKLVTAAQALPNYGWQYFIVSLLFVIAAGFFAVAWKPENPFKSIWVGASFPLLVTAMIQATPPLPPVK